MKMVYKISIAAIALLSLALITAPAFAQYGAGLGAGYGACGGAVAYGAPQDCVAQVYCNIPVTTEVPYMTCTQVAQEVPITVPVQSCTSVEVPRAVIVPETVTVPYMTCAPSTTTVPVTVPVQSSYPVTSLVPQCYTMPVGCGAASACGGYDLGLPGPGR